MKRAEYKVEVIVDVSKAEKPELVRTLAISLGFKPAVLSFGTSSDVGELKFEEENEEEKLVRVEISNRGDIEKATSLLKRGDVNLLVETSNWRVIPLENLVAEAQETSSAIYVRARDPQDALTLRGILERGVDGVIVAPSSLDELKAFNEYMFSIADVDLSLATVERVSKVGVGDRACIDTASMLTASEGMLVGGSSSFLFLVNSENLENLFVDLRPFRVNAGAVSNYLLLPDGRTKYLSEVTCGDRVLVTNSEGRSRVCVVGRVKIESRPLLMVRASSGERSGFVLLQDAETISLVGQGGKVVPLNDLKVGDRVLVVDKLEAARHFGAPVKEFIIEK
ncbi:MAG: 3-dehydroquinate synthase II [Candidatus Bathyarchaeia archaeon]